MVQTRRAALAAAALALLARPGLAQGLRWPSGPVRFIGLFPPGGGTDIMSRLWCQKMSEVTGQQFIVENRASAAGIIGTEAIARAPADGSTIGLGSITPLSMAPVFYARLPYDAARDFTHISGMFQLPNMLVVNKDLPARDVPELIALLKANPGKYTYASSGSGSTLHLSGEMFKMMAGVDMLHVPYRGGGPAQVDLIAGRVHMIFNNIPPALAAVRDGQLRGLAVTSARRSPQAPEVPAMAEFLPGFEITSWGSVLGPAGMAPALVERISQFSKQALESPDLVAKLQENGATAWWNTPEQMAEFRTREEARFTPIIRAAGLRVE